MPGYGRVWPMKPQAGGAARDVSRALGGTAGGGSRAGESPCGTARYRRLSFAPAGTWHSYGTAGASPAAAPAQNLTHMSPKADAHVMTPVNADACVIFHRR